MRAPSKRQQGHHHIGKGRELGDGAVAGVLPAGYGLCQLLTNVAMLAGIFFLVMIATLVFFEVGEDNGWLDRQKRRVDSMTWMGEHMSHGYNSTVQFLRGTAAYNTNYTRVAEEVTWTDSHHLSKNINKVSETWWSVLHIVRRFDELDAVNFVVDYLGFTKAQATSASGTKIIDGVAFMMDVLIEGPESASWQQLNHSISTLAAANPQTQRTVELLHANFNEALERGVVREMLLASPQFISNATALMHEAVERDMLAKADHMMEDVDRMSYALTPLVEQLERAIAQFMQPRDDGGGGPMPQLRTQKP